MKQTEEEETIQKDDFVDYSVTPTHELFKIAGQALKSI
jgi:hypothetical protein